MKRIGFGQVEPNHLSARRTAQIYAQLPAKSDIEILENGQFVKYNYAAGVCDFAGEGEWMMVFNEVKLYDDAWRESYKDFAMIASNYTEGSDDITHDGLGPFPGRMTPRVIKINVGDHWTTNTLGPCNTSGKAAVEYDAVTKETCADLATNPVFLAPNEKTGMLEKVADASGEFVLQVVKYYTLPDGQEAVKVMRIK
jgi:hypothetical protein